VDIAALGEQMEAIAHEAKANDPRALRARVQQLERELAQANAAQPEPVEVPVEVPTLPAGFQEALEAITVAVDALRRVSELPERPTPAPTPAPAPVMRLVPAPAPRPAPVQMNGETDPTLGKAHRAVLTVLATYGTRPVSSVAILSGYSANGGGFRNALSALRTAGYIEGRGDLTITDAGRAAVGPVDPLPVGADLREHWKARPELGRAHGAIIDVLATAHPAPVPVPVVAEQTGYSPDGGGFRNALSRLRTLGLIHGRGEVTLSDDLA
jgi:hypothetical protein